MSIDRIAISQVIQLTCLVRVPNGGSVKETLVSQRGIRDLVAIFATSSRRSTTAFNPMQFMNRDLDSDEVLHAGR